MNTKFFAMLFISLTLFTNISFSQLREIPKAVEETFSQQYNGAANVDFKDQLLSVDVCFELKGEKMIASYTNRGIWKETIKEWDFDKLSAEIKTGFQKSKYADREVEETKVLYLPGGSEQYRIKVKRNDVEKKYLYFNTSGRLLRESITL